MSYSADMDDFAVTYGNFMNAQGMLQCSEKRPVSRANNGNTQKRGQLNEALSAIQFSKKFDLYYHAVNQRISSRGQLS